MYLDKHKHHFKWKEIGDILKYHNEVLSLTHWDGELVECCQSYTVQGRRDKASTRDKLEEWMCVCLNDTDWHYKLTRGLENAYDSQDATTRLWWYLQLLFEHVAKVRSSFLSTHIWIAQYFPHRVLSSVNALDYLLSVSQSLVLISEAPDPGSHLVLFSFLSGSPWQNLTTVPFPEHSRVSLPDPYPCVHSHRFPSG